MMSYAGSGWLPRNCGTCIYIVFEARKEPNEPLQPSILQVRPALAVKPRSLFSNAIRGRASTSAYADSRLWYRAHVGGLRVSRPGRSAYPNGNPRTASDVYTRRGLLLAGGRRKMPNEGLREKRWNNYFWFQWWLWWFTWIENVAV